jgi:hypothetical protein
MAYRRSALPAPKADDATLTANMIGIGMLFAGEGNPNPNIEDTLLHASAAAMEGDDFRVLSVLCTWLGVHAERVNADRLVRVVSAQASPRIRVFWAAFAHWQCKDRRFHRLRRLHRGPRVDLLSVGQDFQLKRFGEDVRFEGGPLRVDAKTLRQRLSDVMSPGELAKVHAAYRWRMIIGPTYRADLWAALQDDSTLSVSDLARKARSSIGTASEVRRDFRAMNADSTFLGLI